MSFEKINDRRKKNILVESVFGRAMLICFCPV